MLDKQNAFLLTSLAYGVYFGLLVDSEVNHSSHMQEELLEEITAVINGKKLLTKSYSIEYDFNQLLDDKQKKMLDLSNRVLTCLLNHDFGDNYDEAREALYQCEVNDISSIHDIIISSIVELTLSLPTRFDRDTKEVDLLSNEGHYSLILSPVNMFMNVRDEIRKLQNLFDNLQGIKDFRVVLHAKGETIMPFILQ